MNGNKFKPKTNLFNLNPYSSCFIKLWKVHIIHFKMFLFYFWHKKKAFQSFLQILVWRIYAKRRNKRVNCTFLGSSQIIPSENHEHSLRHDEVAVGDMILTRRQYELLYGEPDLGRSGVPRIWNWGMVRQ